MLTTFLSIWDAHLSRITTVMHGVGPRVANYTTYTFGAISRGAKTTDLEVSEIEKILAMNVIQPVKTECASPVISHRKMEL